MQLFHPLFRYPILLFASSIEAISKSMKELQRELDTRTGETAGPAAWTSDSAHDLGGNSTGDIAMREVWRDCDRGSGEQRRDERWDRADYRAQPEGYQKAYDQDLCGDDLKYINYAIIFTKRDYAMVLDERKDDLVDYPTDPGSYAGLKIADFMAEVTTGDKKLPPILVDNGVVDDNKRGGYRFKDKDKKYIKFVYKVIQRIPNPDPEYDREKVEKLTGIERGVNNIARNIG